jgi:hypothetical protein
MWYDEAWPAHSFVSTALVADTIGGSRSLVIFDVFDICLPADQA